MDAEQTVREHYSGDDLEARVLDALRGAGVDVDHLKVEDLSGLDQLHAGGVASTEHLLDVLGVTAESRLLDVGAGIGGPARLAAARTGCRVTGIDLSPDFVNVARSITARVGLTDQVTFDVGSATEMPYDDGAFDRAMLNHVGMNIGAKDRVFAEVRRVLEPDGLFAVYEQMRVGEGDLTYPLPWAQDESSSFVETARALRRAVDRGRLPGRGRRGPHRASCGSTGAGRAHPGTRVRPRLRQGDRQQHRRHHGGDPGAGAPRGPRHLSPRLTGRNHSGVIRHRWTTRAPRRSSGRSSSTPRTTRGGWSTSACWVCASTTGAEYRLHVWGPGYAARRSPGARPPVRLHLHRRRRRVDQHALRRGPGGHRVPTRALLAARRGRAHDRLRDGCREPRPCSRAGDEYSQLAPSCTTAARCRARSPSSGCRSATVPR